MAEYNFQHGSFIVPDNNIGSGFIYSSDSVLYDGVDYRLGTLDEYSVFFKTVMSDIRETSNMNKYIHDGMKVASEHTKSRQKEVNYINKMSNVGKRVGGDGKK
jgi:hypothetical protein